MGELVLVATPIGNLGDLSHRAAAVLRDADVLFAEDTRRTRALLSHLGLSGAGRLRSLHTHNEAEQSQHVIDLVIAGSTVAYVSDAGTPGISDPGERLVRACLDAGLAVSCVPGPSALLGALVVSGLPTVPFTFYGFLERKGAPRHAQVGAIAASPHTCVCFESPRRLGATLADLRDACGSSRPAVVVRELTKLHEEVVRAGLGALADAVADGTLAARGECVVLVGPAPAAREAAADTIAARATALVAAGLSARDAADELAAELGIARRRAYAAVLAARGPTAIA
jgi:16S rRNA (cytidine1402-2'-O)-methyltransferase